MNHQQPTGQALEFLPPAPLASASGDLLAIDALDDFLADIDADAAIAACEALWTI